MVAQQQTPYFSMKKVMLITGASSGIGKALAIESAKLGYNLALLARNEENLNLVAAECTQFGAEVVCHIGDVSLFEDCEKFVSNALQHFGRIDVLMNNAGISMRAIFPETDIAVLKHLMDVNFWGTVYCTKLTLPHLLKQKGSVVAVSSVAGFKGLPARTGYSASKFAVNGFMESLRCENLHTGLHVLIACPGYTSSNIRKNALNHLGKSQAETPLDESKLMTPEEVAKRILKGLKAKRRYIIMTPLGWWTVFVNHFLPGFVDRRVYNYISNEPDSPFK